MHACKNCGESFFPIYVEPICDKCLEEGSK